MEKPSREAISEGMSQGTEVPMRDHPTTYFATLERKYNTSVRMSKHEQRQWLSYLKYNSR